jgi:hypothetical protein
VQRFPVEERDQDEPAGGEQSGRTESKTEHRSVTSSPLDPVLPAA